jgi:hypothetical protein
MRTLLSILFTAALTAAAGAADFKAPILNLDGSRISTVPGDEKSPPLTLGKVCEDALIATLPNDNPDVGEKGRRFFLALKIHAGTAELTADEVTLVKKVVGLAYGPLVVGRAIELLDPAAVPK